MAENCSKTHLKNIDFIRLICALGIIIYHYSCESLSSFRPLWAQANGNWGDVFVTAFFILSGAVLYYNYDRIPSYRQFYYKRWKSLYPAFYIAFTAIFLQNVFQIGRVFYMDAPWKLLLAIPAMDGYFSYLVPNNYYLIGEWFLGAIILCYLIYPFLLKSFQKSALFTTIILAVSYIFILSTDFFVIEDAHNLFSILLCLEVGMLIMRYRTGILDRPLIAVPAFILLVILTFIRLPINGTFVSHMAGFCLFLVLYHVGNLVTKNKTISDSLQRLEHGGLSYCVFLLQHHIIYQVIRVKNPVEPWKVPFMIVITTILTLLYAKALLVVTTAMLNSDIYKKIEKRLLGGNR